MKANSVLRTLWTCAFFVVTATGCPDGDTGSDSGTDGDVSCGAGTVLVGGECRPADSACGDGTELVDGECQPVDVVECGEGTELVDGECVPTLVCGADEVPNAAGDACVPRLDCAAGTKLNAAGDACIPDLDCPAGTEANATGTGCDPICADVFEYNAVTRACDCPAGLVKNTAGDDCGPDPALCDEGTIFLDGVCVPVFPPAPSDDDTNNGEPVELMLPAVNDPPLEVGGVIDNALPGDVDVFTFTTTEDLTRVRVQLVAFGLPSGDIELTSDDMPNYFRVATPGENRVAARELVLPVAGTYRLVVRSTTFTVPAGADYSLVIDTLPTVAPTEIDADGVAHTGSLDSAPSFRVSTSSVAAGGIFRAVLAGPETPSFGSASRVLWTLDNAGYQEVSGDFNGEVASDFLQSAGGSVFFVDYRDRQDPTDNSFSVSATERPVTELDGSGDSYQGALGEGEISVFKLTSTPDGLYRLRLAVPNNSNLSPNLMLVSDEGESLFQGEFGGVNADGKRYWELRFHETADAARDLFVVVVNDQFFDPAYNQNFRLTVEFATIGAEIDVDAAAAPVTHDFGTSLSADFDDWTSGWVRVNFGDDGVVTVAPNGPFGYRLYDEGRLGGGFPGDLMSEQPWAAIDGRSILLQAVAFEPGLESQLILSYQTYSDFFAESGYGTFETEPNDPTPQVIGVVPPQWGVLASGDVDRYLVTFEDNGYVDLTMQGTVVPGQLWTVAIESQDGSTVLHGPATFPSEYEYSPEVYLYGYLEAGTYQFVVRELTPAGVDGKGLYNLFWNFYPGDPPVPEPTCAAPATLTPGEMVFGNTAGGTADWQPLDYECFGYEQSRYFAENSVYEIAVPDGVRLRARIDAGFDAALAIVAPDCAGACLDGSDRGYGDEEVQWLNDTGAEATVVVIVDGWAGQTGWYELFAELLDPPVCESGVMQCNGDDIEVCNYEGTGFETQRTCAGGCGFDDFELVPYCLPVCGPGTQGPLASCNGNELSACSDDGTEYVVTNCSVECTIFDDGVDVIGGACTYGLCETIGIGGAVCDDTNTIATVCSGDEGRESSQGCAYGCDGGACLPPPAFYDWVFGGCFEPYEGARLENNLSFMLYEESGLLGNDFSGPTCGLDSVNPQEDFLGGDLWFVLGSKPAGTQAAVTVRSESGALLSLGALTSCAGTCLGDGNLPGPTVAPAYEGVALTYTYDGTEADGVIIVVDTDEFYFGLEMAVSFSDAPVAPAVCETAGSTCVDSIVTVCSSDLTRLEQMGCAAGCNLDGDDCAPVTSGAVAAWDACVGGSTLAPPAPIVLPYPGERATFTVDLSGRGDDFTSYCAQPGTPDAFVSLVVPAPGYYRFEVMPVADYVEAAMSVVRGFGPDCGGPIDACARGYGGEWAEAIEVYLSDEEAFGIWIESFGNSPVRVTVDSVGEPPDFCELNGWYGDGYCDEGCPQPDPDCFGGPDICEIEGLYGNGFCDDFCPQPDPDCFVEPDICEIEGLYGNGFCDEFCLLPDPDCI